MKRILSLFSVLFLVTLVTFIMTNLAPSDSAEMYYLSKGITPSEEVLNETRHEMGLDKNIVVRYVDWLNDFVHGDLGYSYHYGQDVNQQMLSKLPNTLKLAMFSFVVVLAFSIPLGIYSATHRHSLINSILKNIAFLGLSLPNFWLALILILLFSVKIQLFPVISGSSLNVTNAVSGGSLNITGNGAIGGNLTITGNITAANYPQSSASSFTVSTSFTSQGTASFAGLTSTG